MTNEEAIDLLKMIEFENAECNLGTWYHGIDGDMKEALEMAIKALEQEPVLDKIRAEIMLKDGLEEALEIIDKYKAESEE